MDFNSKVNERLARVIQLNAELPKTVEQYSEALRNGKYEEAAVHRNCIETCMGELLDTIALLAEEKGATDVKPNLC